MNLILKSLAVLTVGLVVVGSAHAGGRRRVVVYVDRPVQVVETRTIVRNTTVVTSPSTPTYGWGYPPSHGWGLGWQSRVTTVSSVPTYGWGYTPGMGWGFDWR